MKKLKQILTLLLVFVFSSTTISVSASTSQEAEPDFSYSACFVSFLSGDVAQINIELSTETKTEGDISTECYIPVYKGNTQQLVDIFYLPIRLENPFSEATTYSFTHDLNLTDPSIGEYRFKVIMLDSLETLSPEGTVNSPSDNEFYASNLEDHRFVQFDGVIPYVAFHDYETVSNITIKGNPVLFEGALDAGYTVDDFAPGTIISVQNYDAYLNSIQGLYCRIMLNILEDGTYVLWWAQPLEGYNDTVFIKPINLENPDNGNNEAEYYASEYDTELSYLPLADSVTVYKNLQTASYSDITPGHSETIMEYLYTDTDIDGYYDTVYIIYEEVFRIGYINASTYKLYPDMDAMRTYAPSNLSLNPTATNTFYSMPSFDTFHEGQIVHVLPSYDGMYTHYEVYAEDPVIVVGEVSNVVQILGVINYEIGNNNYRILSSDVQMLEVGDYLTAYCYADVIVGYELQLNPSSDMGIVLGTSVTTLFDTEYKAQIMNRDGEVVTYNFASRVNGTTPSWTTSSQMATAIPTGDIIVYSLNDNDEIVSYDIQTGYNYYYANLLPEQYRFVEDSAFYRLSTHKLGSYFITDETRIYATDAIRTEVSDDNITKTDESILLDGETYSYSVLYNSDNKEAALIILYETEIPTYDDTPEILDDIYYGMVISTAYTDDFEPIYQIQILESNGDISTYNIAKRINGSLANWNNADELEAAFPKGDIIAYQLDSNREFAMYDIESDYQSEYSNVLDQAFVFDCNTHAYNATDRTIGSFQLTDSTVIFASLMEDQYINSINVLVANENQLIDENTYSYSVLAYEDGNIEILMLHDADLIYHSDYPLVITKKVTVDNRTQYYGFVNGEETAYTVSENAEAKVSEFGVGDIINFSVNEDDEIVSATILVDKTEEGFLVIDNAMEGTYDDATSVSQGNYVTISTEELPIITTAAQAKTAADSMMQIGNSAFLKGFGAAGKAYSISTRSVRLMNANDYKQTFEDSNTERYYTDKYEDDRIKDYYISYEPVAYLYNAVEEKISVSSIYNAETDVNTFDFRNAAQLENDDLVYIYNYDGETKLFLIIDVKGDTI